MSLDYFIKTLWTLETSHTFASTNDTTTTHHISIIYEKENVMVYQ